MEDKDMVIAQERQLTAVDIRKQVNLIQEVMREVMIGPDKNNPNGVHYGLVPGCGKKYVLLKPGAEKIAMTFRLSPSFAELPGSGEGDDFVHYKIECRLTHIPTGRTVGTGLGACNSKEKKYRTRSVYANKATDDERAIGKKETRKNDDGTYEVFIVPQDPWDVQNTVYKMACKRAFIAAILNATAASDIFTQDIEDVPEGTVLEENGAAPVSTKPPVEMPKAKTEAPKEQPWGEENREAEKPKTGPVISQAQGKRLYAIALGNGFTNEDIREFLEENFGIDSPYKITKEFYEDIVLHFQTPKAKDE